MKALVLDKPGTPESLYPTDLEQPKPGPGEVCVKVHAVGLNPVDYKLAASGFPGWDYPMILGVDVAGVIDSVGKGVDEWQPGDPVYYLSDLSKPGGYSQYAIITTRTLAWLPEGLSYTDAAALPCAGFTAYQALHRKIHVQKRQDNISARWSRRSWGICHSTFQNSRTANYHYLLEAQHEFCARFRRH